MELDWAFVRFCCFLLRVVLFSGGRCPELGSTKRPFSDATLIISSPSKLGCPSYFSTVQFCSSFFIRGASSTFWSPLLNGHEFNRVKDVVLSVRVSCVEKGKVWRIFMSPIGVDYLGLIHPWTVGRSKCTEDECSPVIPPAQQRGEKLPLWFLVNEFFQRFLNL